MKLEILTPDKSLFKGEIQSLSVPGKVGAFMVLNNHAPLISSLVQGDITFQTKDYQEEKITINGGVIEIKNNTVVILADA